MKRKPKFDEEGRTNSQEGHKLGEGNQEKEEVEEELELVDQHDRDEGYYIVFLVPNLIMGKISRLGCSAQANMAVLQIYRQNLQA